MEKYQKGKIYKLTCSENDLVYYGSTINKLKLRLQKHKSDYKSYLKGKSAYITSFEIMKYASTKIELVEEISCDTKKELLARERHYIENNTCVNKVIPGRTYKEYKKDNREEINKKNNEYMKEYMKKNKKEKREYDIKYQQKNKQKIRERKKEKLQCDCGREITKQHIPRHKKTNIHITTLFNINNNN